MKRAGPYEAIRATAKYIPQLAKFKTIPWIRPQIVSSMYIIEIASYWDTCGSPVIKCLCFSVVFFFSSATKWKNCAIVPSGHWALNTMTTKCNPLRCSHAGTRVTLMMNDVVMHGHCILYPLCTLQSAVCSLYFVSGLQSAICILY